jgi:hypothetical protein
MVLLLRYLDLTVRPRSSLGWYWDSLGQLMDALGSKAIGALASPPFLEFYIILCNFMQKWVHWDPIGNRGGLWLRRDLVQGFGTKVWPQLRLSAHSIVN